MSRVGRQPIPVPKGVTVKIENRFVHVKGKLGELGRPLPDGIEINKEGDTLQVTRADESRQQKSLHGLIRTLVSNMVVGVNDGFKRDLEVVGVGYRCEQKGKALQLAVGFSHRVIFIPPEGITLKANTVNLLSVTGIDKELVGEVASKIRAIRPPEPFRGKGIKYVEEVVRRKAGKSAGK